MKKDYQARLEEISAMDRDFWAQGITIAGMDEAGRGPLAGPVCAACVIMPETPLLLYVDDSKKVTEKRREMLYEQIHETTLFVGVGLASVREIDEMNILQATKLAMRRAAQGARCDLFLIDAVDKIDLRAPVRGVIHGDSLSYSIAAASIVAKVTRDRILAQLDEAYPQYAFAKNKGYGTAQHIAALREFGACSEHRRTFIGNFVHE